MTVGRDVVGRAGCGDAGRVTVGCDGLTRGADWICGGLTRGADWTCGALTRGADWTCGALTRGADWTRGADITAEERPAG